jgi:hypothetical protein
MTRRLVVTVCVAGTASLLWATPGAATPQPDPDKQCKKGYVRGSERGGEVDQNGNGFVCVDDAGNVRDDKDQFAGDQQGSPADADANGNMIVCHSPEGVWVDDDGLGGCPDGFNAEPPLSDSLAADDNQNFIVCWDQTNDTYVDDTMTEIGSECPEGYILILAHP